MRKFALISLFSLMLPLSGCVTTLNLMSGGNLGKADVSSEHVGGGVDVTVTIKKGKGLVGWEEVVGFPATAILWGNLPRVFLTFASEAAASQASVAVAVGGLVVDAWVNSTLHSDPVPAKVYLTYTNSQGMSNVISAVPVHMTGSIYKVFVPVHPSELREAESLTVRVENANQHTLAINNIDLGNQFARQSPMIGPPMSKAPSKAKTPPKKAVPERTVPPQLTTEVTFEEPVGDRALHADEGGTFVIKVTNSGKGVAQNSVAQLQLESPVRGITFSSQQSIGDIAPGESRTIHVPVRADRQLSEGQAALMVNVEDENHYDAPPVKLSFHTRSYAPAELVVAQTGVEDDVIPKRGRQINYQVMVKNEGGVPARNITVTLNPGHKSIIPVGPETVDVKDLPPGGWGIAKFELFVKNSYNGPNELPLSVSMTEGKTGSTKKAPVALVLDQNGPRIREIAVAPVAETKSVEEAPELTVDVDQPIAKKARTNKDAIGVVIGIEDYTSLPDVTFAKRDAETVKRYFRDVLGIEETNIRTLLDREATKTQLELTFERKLKLMGISKDTEVFVYFAGHGAPDVATRQAFLVPVDGDPNFPDRSCYSASSMYKALADLNAKNVTVILDACFTGQTGRTEKPAPLLADARQLTLVPTEVPVPKGITVFAASSATQISSGYRPKRHGLFTYYFLKALRGDSGTGNRLTVKALQDYLYREVSRTAVQMDREQTPVLTESGDANRVLVGD